MVFLVVVGLFAWPGYQAVTAVILPSASIVAPTEQPPRSPPEEKGADRSTPTAQPIANPSAPMPTQAQTPTLATTRTFATGPARTPPRTHVPTQVLVQKALRTPISTTVPTATPPPTPHLWYLDEKLYMLRLINNERRSAGVPEVELGVNDAAQLHAEDSLEGCHSSHWGSDGLKPYMRYSLAGGYQSNGENGSGRDYCIRARDGYVALSGIKTEIREAMAG